MTEEADTVKARAEQSKAAKEKLTEDFVARATEGLFDEKKPAEDEKTYTVNGSKVSFLFRAIGRKEYDKLLTECPPSTAQRAAGETYDQEKFAPKLLSRCIVDPARSEVAWRNTWNDENWNRSELATLFFACVAVCSIGLNPDPTESG